MPPQTKLVAERFMQDVSGANLNATKSPRRELMSFPALMQALPTIDPSCQRNLLHSKEDQQQRLVSLITDPRGFRDPLIFFQRDVNEELVLMDGLHTMCGLIMLSEGSRSIPVDEVKLHKIYGLEPPTDQIIDNDSDDAKDTVAGPSTSTKRPREKQSKKSTKSKNSKNKAKKAKKVVSTTLSSAQEGVISELFLNDDLTSMHEQERGLDADSPLLYGFFHGVNTSKLHFIEAEVIFNDSRKDEEEECEDDHEPEEPQEGDEEDAAGDSDQETKDEAEEDEEDKEDETPAMRLRAMKIKNLRAWNTILWRAADDKTLKFLQESQTPNSVLMNFELVTRIMKNIRLDVVIFEEKSGFDEPSIGKIVANHMANRIPLIPHEVASIINNDTMKILKQDHTRRLFTDLMNQLCFTGEDQLRDMYLNMAIKVFALVKKMKYCPGSTPNCHTMCALVSQMVISEEDVELVGEGICKVCDYQSKSNAHLLRS